MKATFLSLACALMLVGCAATMPKDCSYCPAMVRIPAGAFLMGSTPSETEQFGMPDRHATVEWPQHRVVVRRDFLMSKYEITRAEYAVFSAATSRSAKPCLIYSNKKYSAHSDSSWRNPLFEQGDDHPVVCVDWADANAYADWLSRETGFKYRLPSEAEWEYAARAGSSTARYWDDTLGNACQYANVADASSERPQFDCTDPYTHTAPVGYGLENAFGLNAMLGNVGEFVADCGLPNYASADGESSAKMSGDCSTHVGRGGSYWNDAYYLRAARRYSFSGAYRIVGIRLVRDL